MLAWTLYRRAISAMVSCSRRAARATLALNVGLCLLRLRFMFLAPILPVASFTFHLNPWSEKRGALHGASVRTFGPIELSEAVQRVGDMGVEGPKRLLEYLQGMEKEGL